MDYPMTLRDLNNPVFVAEFSPEAEWKRTLLIACGRRFGLTNLIETGTCWGDTVASVRPFFEQVYSIELSPKFYESAKSRFENDQHVHLYFGSSRLTLESVLKDAPAGPLLFWLDAHVTGGPSADDGDQVNPELYIIQRDRPESLVLIDDVRPHGLTGYIAPDGPITIPNGWTAKFLSGVLALHTGGYDFPEL